MSRVPKKSLHEWAKESKRALIFGIGGGGDAIQGIPVMNYLKCLGVEKVWLGGVSCQWWPPSDLEFSPYAFVLAPTIYSVRDILEAELLSEAVALVSKESKVAGHKLPEAILAELFGIQTLVLDVGSGGAGMALGLRQAIDKLGIELLVAMDVGSDSFFSGKDEVKHPRTPLVDLLSLAAVYQQELPSIYGLAGYGCDGELELEDLERNVAKVMRAGGFLGAYGLTQKDVADLERACSAIPDPVEKWPFLAAKGKLGLFNMKLMDTWGSTIRLTPLTAVILFFDPKTLVDKVAVYAKRLINTGSLEEAEEILLSSGILPETRLIEGLNFFRQRRR